MGLLFGFARDASVGWIAAVRPYSFFELCEEQRRIRDLEWEDPVLAFEDIPVVPWFATSSWDVAREHVITVEADPPKLKRWKRTNAGCTACGGKGHNRQTCPDL
jgi:hypothetical protein